MSCSSVGPVLLFVVFYFCMLFHLTLSGCPHTFECGKVGPLEYSLTNSLNPECGELLVDCGTSGPRIKIEGEFYNILWKESSNKFVILSPLLKYRIEHRLCSSFSDFILPNSPIYSVTISPNISLTVCSNLTSPKLLYMNYSTCDEDHKVIFFHREKSLSFPKTSLPEQCSWITLPSKPPHAYGDIFDIMSDTCSIEWSVSEQCNKCRDRGGQCRRDYMNMFECRGKGPLKLILATAIPCGLFIIVVCFLSVFLVYLIRRRKNRAPHEPEVEIREWNGVPVFSYDELEEATNGFNSSNTLGEGGYGTVFYGKLRDGREIAIKQLSERNHHLRLEQFTHEVGLLTSLRHQHLVSLYGCTIPSSVSESPLLVFEYIPNGPLAYHLLQRPNGTPLTWALRLKIATEAASGIMYLHHEGIIHRDLKSDNILLDDSFSAKVADFGLSKQLAPDTTHISTGLHGTDGYIDPEYSRTYQLTVESDVYSFGVILLELISSLTAVDLDRPEDERNLSSLAVKRKNTQALGVFMDSGIGYNSDVEIRRMMDSVAELAFQCIKDSKVLRPRMEEVFNTLERISGAPTFEIRNFEVGSSSTAAVALSSPSPVRYGTALLGIREWEDEVD